MSNLPGKVEVVIPADYGLGEAPHWDYSTNTLLYVDCESSTIYRWNPTTNEIKTIVLPGIGFKKFAVLLKILFHY